MHIDNDLMVAYVKVIKVCGHILIVYLSQMLLENSLVEGIKERIEGPNTKGDER
jgi:hypothetical protein